MCVLRCEKDIEKSAVVVNFVSQIEGLEVCGQRKDGAKDDAAELAWVGDGTDEITLAVCHCSTQAISVPEGEIMATGQVTEGAKRGTADAQTMELIDVDENEDPDDRELEDSEAVSDHKFKRAKLSWIPMFVQAVGILCCGNIGGFERGLKRAQDESGLAFRVIFEGKG